MRDKSPLRYIHVISSVEHGFVKAIFANHKIREEHEEKANDPCELGVLRGKFPCGDRL
jgi:hypothetical protein